MLILRRRLLQARAASHGKVVQHYQKSNKFKSLAEEEAGDGVIVALKLAHPLGIRRSERRPFRSSGAISSIDQC